MVGGDEAVALVVGHQPAAVARVAVAAQQRDALRAGQVDGAVQQRGTDAQARVGAVGDQQAQEEFGLGGGGDVGVGAADGQRAHRLVAQERGVQAAAGGEVQGAEPKTGVHRGGRGAPLVGVARRDHPLDGGVEQIQDDAGTDVPLNLTYLDIRVGHRTILPRLTSGVPAAER
ncbi:MAG TPA: hypothetical protein VE172_21220 [Stackebrandtia sp.]|nr:hypothetical protein [Stackebrandtia sp.]HZE41328.1 hypothetical protein [Stackebrandtia sp.]